MKKRFIYTLLFGIPGMLIAFAAAFLAFGAAAGFFWIFLFGDDPWPPGAEIFLSILFALVAMVLWSISLAWGHRVGKRLETDTFLNRKHILLSAAVTAAMLLLVVFHQFRVGNLGPRSDSRVCSDFCREQGFSASGLTPRDKGDRVCSCYDGNGRAVLDIRLDSLAAEKGN